MSLSLNTDYKVFFKNVKDHIKQAQMRASIKVNQELLLLYWQLGKRIIEVQSSAEWGDKVLTQLSADLKKSFPGMKGFSRTNLMNMRRFAFEYPSEEFVQQAVGQITRSHNILLLEKISDPVQRVRYAQKAVQNGRSRNTMTHRIETDLYKRDGKAITNFSTTLSKANTDLAQSILKDPYKFDFLGLTEEAQEKEIEDALTKKITQFLLELGSGFAYMGRQFQLKVGQEDFYLDLLFYHVKLRCYVVIELKTTKFKPEYAGKIGFYQTAIDREIKTSKDNPTIGILLCKGKDEVTAQYTLDSLKQPVGISEYKLDNGLPEKFINELPSIEKLKQELNEIEAWEE